MIPDLAAGRRRILIVGVGGAGMGAIAEVLLGMGHDVVGTDATASPMTRRLSALGVEVHIGHSASVVDGADLVCASTAIGPDAPELIAAREAGIEPLRRAELLAGICARRSTLAVAGTHGKTTTTSMLAVALRFAALDPSYVIGGEVSQLGTGAHWGTGDFLVVEADESDGTFVELPRHAALVTNVEPDHLEHHGGFDALVRRFAEFVDATPGPVLCCADDDGATALATTRSNARTYGIHERVDYRMSVPTPDPGSGVTGGMRWSVKCPDGAVTELALRVPGLHQALNATAAFALAAEVGVDRAALAAGLESYAGVRRRFEARGQAGGVTFIDDYAHLPTEVKAVVATARSLGPERVVAVFQPHRYSRTASLWRELADAFVGADLVVVTDVYALGEPPRAGVSGALVVGAVLDEHPRERVVYLPGLDDVVTHLPGMLRAGDLCLTMGAGDLTGVPDRLVEALQRVTSSRP